MRTIFCALTLCAAFFAVSSLAQAPPATSDSGSNSSTASGEKIYHPERDHVTVPTCFYKPNPPYSKEAKAAKYEGSVFAEGVIRPNGKITDVKIKKSPMELGLEEPVLKTLKKWKCNPSTGPDGIPVAAYVMFDIRFHQ
jgi:TonB family protein